MSLPSCLTLRTVKGSVLSWVELDNNFICLNNSINNVASLIHNGNMWHIPSGSTVTIETDYQHFIYGDMIIEGTLQLSGGSQLVVLNGDLIFSGGSVVGDGDIYNITLPEFDTKVSGLTYSGDTLTIYQNDGSTYSTTIVNSTDVTVTGGTYNPTTGTATFYDNNGGNFDVNGFLTGYTDVKVSGLTYSGDTLTLTQTDGSNFNVIINSSTPFTGNTSGDCITDLYVTNLNSCSPLHIQPVNTGDVYISENGGNVGIGTSSPTSKLVVSGKTYISESLGIGITPLNDGIFLAPTHPIRFGDTNHYIYNSGDTLFINGWTHLNLNSSTDVGILTNNINRLFINSTGNVGIGTITPTKKLHVSGDALFSSSTNNVVTIIGSGSSMSSPLFNVQGSSGQLFSVSDSLIGSLFSVNNISGLPILETFSDNTILMGDFNAPSLNTTIKLNLSAGTNTIYSIPTSAYTGAFFDYTLISSTGARAGNVMSIWSGTTSQYTDVSTNDIGNTSGVSFSVLLSSGNAILTVSATTNNWIIKTIVRSI